MGEDALIIFVIIFLVGFIVFAVYKVMQLVADETSANRRKEEAKAHRCTVENFAQNKKESTLNQYIAENHITMREDSYSNLGLCGVSDKYLHYNLDKFNPPDSFGIYNRKECVVLGKRILLESIRCFKIDGSLHYTSNVEGGGVNLSGAVAGAVLAGGAAAIIGSRLGTDIKTSVVKHDERAITIFFDNEGEIDTIRVVSSDFDKTVGALRKLIPNKEEAVVQMETQESQQSVIQVSSADEIRKFKELLDSGIISQEEFDAKKKQLLGL